MKNILNIIIFIGSILALIISIKLLWNIGVFVDEFNISPNIVFGGSFWVYTNWFRLFTLTIITIVAGVNLCNKGD